MRRLALLAVTAAFIAVPALAENPKGGVNLGGTKCKPSFPCASLTDGTMNGEALAEKGNECVESGLNMTESGGFFEPGLGFNSDECLRTKKIKKSSRGLTAIPVCCLRHENENSCYMFCKLVGVQ